MSDVAVPEVKQRLVERVKTALQSSETAFRSFTTDAWTSTGSQSSFMALTCHWVAPDWKRMSALPSLTPLLESHTGDYLSSKFLEMFEKWNIPVEKVHIVLRNNGANIIKALRVSEVSSQGCMAHTLQLVLKQSVLQHEEVKNLLKQGRAILGHFKHSPTATESLRKLQKRIGAPEHNLLQDVPTRWNSSLEMLQRLLEQKQTIGLYATDSNLTLDN